MAQIQIGTAIVTNASNVVTGVGVDWTQVAVNNIFVIAGRAQTYLIVSRTLTGSTWTLTLERPYGETSSTSDGLAYAIQKDFTPNLNLPIISAGDIDVASIMTRAFMILDSQTSSGGSGGGTSITFSSGGAGYVIGTIVCIDTSTGAYAMADSNVATRSNVVGVVSNVVGGTVTIVTSGLISGVYGGTLVAGSIYYVAGSPATAALNYVVSGGVTNHIPAFQAQSTTAAFVIPSSAGSSGPPFTPPTSVAAGVAGLVPAPPVNGMTKVLSGSGWVSNVPAVGSSTAGVFVPRSNPILAENNYGLWDTVPHFAASSPADLLYDLLMRTRRMGLRQVNDAVTTVNLSLSNGYALNTTNTWTVPAGVTYILVEMWGGGGGGVLNSPAPISNNPALLGTLNPNISALPLNSASAPYAGLSTAGKAGAYCRFLLAVTPGWLFTFKLGQGHNQDQIGLVFTGDTSTTYTNYVIPTAGASGFTLTLDTTSTWLKLPTGAMVAYAEGGAGLTPSYNSAYLQGYYSYNSSNKVYTWVNHVPTTMAQQNTVGETGIQADQSAYLNGNLTGGSWATQNAGGYTIVGRDRAPQAYLYQAAGMGLVYPSLNVVAAGDHVQGVEPFVEGYSAFNGGRGGRPVFGLDSNSIPWCMGAEPGGGAAALTMQQPTVSGNSPWYIYYPKGGNGMIRITY